MLGWFSRHFAKIHLMISFVCQCDYGANYVARRQKDLSYINTNEITNELSRENMISSHVIFTREKIIVAMVTYKNRAF